MEDAQKQRDWQRDLQRMFARHLVLIFGPYQQLDDEGKDLGSPKMFTYSGFVVSILGKWSIVTAGHVVNDIDKKLNHRNVRVGSFHLLDYFGRDAKFSSAIPFDYDDAAKYAEHVPSEGLDYGYLSLTDNQVSLLESNGIIPLPEEFWIPDERLDFRAFFVLGFPEEFVTQDRRLNVAGEKVLGEVRPVLLPLGPVTVEEAAEKDPDDAWFAGRIDTRIDISSVVGMSGGPVFGITADGEYRVVAVQSWWDPPTRIAYACRSQKFGMKTLQVLERLIQAEEQAGLPM